MGAPRRKRGRGAGKAPERPWSRREEAPFMPQARRASLLGRRAEVHLEKHGGKGRAMAGGTAAYHRSGARIQYRVVRGDRRGCR